MVKNLEELFIEIGERSDWPPCFDSIEVVRSRINCYTDKLIDHYDPVQMWNFKIQVEQWLNNIERVDEKFLLLNCLTYFTFFNREHYEALYREALNGVIIQWLIDINDIDILCGNQDCSIADEINKTLFSAATDSMEISAFCHTNNLTHKDRPVWFSEIRKYNTPEALAQAQKEWASILRRWGQTQIVVLEDFVASGQQIQPIIDFLAGLSGCKTIIVPLTICPQGDRAIRQHIVDKEYSNVAYAPVTVLPDDFILGTDRLRNNQILTMLKDFAEKNHQKVIGLSSKKTPGYLGYGDIGALFAKYTNCPNNSLPLFWYGENEGWVPLFRRNERKNHG